MRGVGAFTIEYVKRFGILAALVSLVCFVAFFMAIIPVTNVVPSETHEFTHGYVGGAYAERTAVNTVYDERIPRNADGELLKLAGTFKVTHYCACTICTWGSGITASGKHVAEGMIASDWSVLPQGTKVYIKRGDSLIEKVVEDRGGAINGNIIDVYVNSHEYALQLGVYYAEIYVDPYTALPAT